MRSDIIDAIGMYRTGETTAEVAVRRIENIVETATPGYKFTPYPVVPETVEMQHIVVHRPQYVEQEKEVSTGSGWWRGLT